MMLTRDELMSFLNYNPDTGAFTWRIATGRQASGSSAGSFAARGYIQISVKRKLYRAHRLAWLYVHGEWPLNEIDHINGSTHDNRIANLRLADSRQNKGNTKLNCNNKSGFRGVYRHSEGRGWVANISIGGNAKYLGTFKCKRDAAEAYRKAAVAHFGEFARSA